MQMQMKKLNRVRLVNWMYFGMETFPINQGSVLISGENAAGKSTVLDAIQMVLTGNTRRFNKAANENSDRDLKSYVRCKINTTEKTFLRTGTVIGNVALEFYEEKERRWFVIGVHLTSVNETEPVAKKWYIEEGRLEDFSFLTGKQKPAMAEEFRKNDEKIRYIHRVSEYQDNLRRRLGSLEEKFFEVLLKALAFRPVDNVKDFINKYVLSEKAIDVQSLRESIDVLNEFERTLKKAQEERDYLENIINRFKEIEDNDHSKDVNEVLLEIIEQELLKASKKECEKHIVINNQALESTEKEKESIEDQLKTVKNKLLELNQAYNNTDYARLTEKLTDSLELAEKEKREITKSLQRLTEHLEYVKACLTLFQAIKDLPVHGDEFKKLALHVSVREKAEILSKIQDYIATVIEEIREKKYEIQVEKKAREKQIIELDKNIESLKAQTIKFPEETENLRNCIQKEFNDRGIDSRVYVFSELLTITDKSWTNAIEGYLNTQRFYLIVEPEYYHLALEIYSSNRKSYNQGIINFRKLPEVPEREENSLACFVESENRYAKRYVDFILGKVICCNTLRELENHHCAVTKDCMVYKNYVSRKIDPKIYSKPYIGKDAVEIQLKNCLKERKSLQDSLPELQNNLAFCEQAIQTEEKVNCEVIKQNFDAPGMLGDLEKRIEEYRRELESIAKNPDVMQLQLHISQQEEKESALQKEKDKLIGKATTLKNEIDRLSSQVKELCNQIESKEAQLKEYENLKTAVYNEAVTKYEGINKNRSIEQIREGYLRQKVAYENKGQRFLNGEKNYPGLMQLQSTYNSVFGRDFIVGKEGKDSYKSRFIKLDGMEIIRYEESIRIAKDKCEDIFKNEFLSKMKESIETARYEFDNLKKALKDINYGEDTYRFIISANAQKHNLYNMIMSEENMGKDNLFSSGFQNQYKDEIEELFSKIKSGDSGDAAVREYTDYRTYLDYDIEIVKKNGTIQKLSAKAKSNSGGESQVPFYVIMGASLNTIYKNNNSIRLLLLDEAFNNMDEQRIESVMQFFKALDFQTILVAPSPKIQDIEEHVDSVITVMREDTVSFAEDFKYYGD